jgi:hypothetical protein
MKAMKRDLQGRGRRFAGAECILRPWRVETAPAESDQRFMLDETASGDVLRIGEKAGA